MKHNRIMAITAAAVIAALPVTNISAADAKMTAVTPVLDDFNADDVNGRVIVRMPAELTAEAEIDFSSPEGKSISYYKSELESSVVYSFDIEGRDNTAKDYRYYMLHISFTDTETGSVTPSLDLSFDIPDGTEKKKSFTVYDYTFELSTEQSEEFFEHIEPASGSDKKIGDIYYPETFLVHTRSYLRGDVNGDGKISPVDASAVLVECALLSDGGTGKFDARKKAAADVDKDGKLTAKDASAILVYCADLTEKGSATWKN